LPTSRWRLLWPGTWRSVTAVSAIDWQVVIPRDQWQEHWTRAHQVLTDAASART
jgi:hypothetical protein